VPDLIVTNEQVGDLSEWVRSMSAQGEQSIRRLHRLRRTVYGSAGIDPKTNKPRDPDTGQAMEDCMTKKLKEN
jgi:hypothetical protein